MIVRFCFVFRDSAAVDECKAKTCLDALLVYLDEQRDHSVKDNNILQAPDFLGMKYLMMVGQTCINAAFWQHPLLCFVSVSHLILFS